MSAYAGGSRAPAKSLGDAQKRRLFGGQAGDRVDGRCAPAPGVVLAELAGDLDGLRCMGESQAGR